MSRRKRAYKKQLYFRKSFIEKLALGTYYIAKDAYKFLRNPVRKFPTGHHCFIGFQGSGKTASAVGYIKTILEIHKNAIVVSNIHLTDIPYIKMESMYDIMKYRNGEEGVIFLIDELSSEMSSAQSKNFNEQLLSEISQQRKQRIHIISTAQVFMRLAKPLREQCHTVVRNFNIKGRIFFNIGYDAWVYEAMAENANLPEKRKKMKRNFRRWFICDDALYAAYDTYEKVERLSKIEGIPAHQRLQ